MAADIGDGTELPPYASEENKQLDAEIKQKEGELSKVEEKLHSDSSRVKVMTDHLVNVQQELVNTQQLVEAKRHEAETEDHLKALSNRQVGRLKAEIVRLQKVVEDTQDQVNGFSNELMRGNEKLDQFKLEMNWNQEELEQWAIAARQKEEDQITLEKYRRSDDVKVRDLSLAIEKLTVETVQKKKDLADLITETQAKQIEMDKTAELFRQLHDDRKKLIDQWEESVQTMQQRDAQLQKLGEEFASHSGRKKVKEDKMKERQRFLKDIEADNEKLELGIQQTDRQLARMRLDYMETKGSIQGFKDEVEVMKNQLTAFENEKMQAKNELAMLGKSLEQRKAKHEALQRNLKQSQKALEDAIAMTKDKEGLSAAAEAAREKMYEQLRTVEREMKAAKENLYKESQELYRLRAEEATTLGEISGAQSAIKNLQFQISKLDQERQRQQELLYAVDFQSQLMQRKVARVSGERTIEEKDEFNKKVGELEKQLEEQKSLQNILGNQIKRQDAELKNTTRSLADVRKENEAMGEILSELDLQNSVLAKSVTVTMKDKEETLMQHDILRLEVKRLRQQLNSRSENLYSLENRKEQLQISMEEREKEIDVHTEVLKAQVRAAEEERHKAAIELAERKTKIYCLKSKYENIMCKVKKEDGEENVSQAHYMIKAAQEKEELQRKGDELDDRIRRAEKEIRSLENTLGHLVQRNQKFKATFLNASAQSQAEIEEKQMLEEQSRAANEVLFKKKKALTQLEKEEQEDMQRYDELQNHLHQLHSHFGELQAAREVLISDIESQKPKLARAQQVFDSTKRRAVEAGLELTPNSDVMLDLEVRGLRDEHQSVLFAMGNALQDHTEDVYPLFNSLCAEKGLARPSRPPSVASSRPQSSRSSYGLSARTPPP